VPSSPETCVSERPNLWLGAGFCIIFAVIAVALRGARWDETFEHAQILSGQVTCPEGHPLALYVHNAFSLQTHLSAWLLSLGAGPVLACGFRNVLFLLASMLPVYALTATLTRSVWAALLASLLMMQGILLEFDGSYPTMVWPETYSNGHIGGGVVLLALAALIAGRYAMAFFMLGLIPTIHVGQWPPLAATCALFGALVLLRERDGKPATRWVGYFALGLGATLLFWLIHRQTTLPMPEAGPFAAGGDTEAVWKGFTALHDPHRRFPPGNGHVILLGTMLLAWLGACFASSARLRQACVGLALYTTVVGALVWGTMAVHAWMGPDIPFLLIAWMPYRLINHIPAIMLALAITLIVLRWPQWGVGIVVGAVLFGVVQPLWPLVVGEALHARYLAGGEFMAFAVFGVALFAVAPHRESERWTCIALTVAAIVPLAMYHRFGAACVVAGVITGYIVNRLFLSRDKADSCHTISPKGEFECAEQSELHTATESPALPSGSSPGTKGPRHVAPNELRVSPAPHSNSPFGEIVWHKSTSRILPVVIMVIVLGAIALLGHQFVHRKHLPVSQFQMGIARELSTQERVLLLAPPDNLLLQATTNLPVLAEVATPSLISYVPAIGPAINQLYEDLYGMNFLSPDPTILALPTWQAIWSARDVGQWHALAQRYGFTHIIAPADVTLSLRQILAADGYALYAVGP